MPRMPIIISSKWTRATWLSNLSAQHLYNWMRHIGLSPIKVSGWKSGRAFVEKELLLAKPQPKPLLIMYFGHGEDDAWIGREGPLARGVLKKRLIRLGVNADKLGAEPSIIYAISCFTMNKLGPYLVNNGETLSYFGSTEKMVVTPFDNNLEPKTVPDFVDIFTIGQKMLICGTTTQQAYQAYQNRCSEILKAYKESGLMKHSKKLTSSYYGIKMNKEYFKLIGETGARWYKPETEGIERQRVEERQPVSAY